MEAETSDYLGGDAETYSHQFRIVRPDGSVRLILDRGIIERDPGGARPVIRGMNIDLGEVESSVHANRMVETSALRDAELEALYIEGTAQACETGCRSALRAHQQGAGGD